MGKRKINQDNKIIWILLAIIIICFLVLGLGFYKYFYGGASSSKYGERLDGIDAHPLSENLEEEISSLYKDENTINKVSVDVKGRIIYIIIDFGKTLKVATAKDLAVKSITKIDENNLAYYDIQFILTYSGEEENSNFPVFGSKSASSLKAVW